MAVRPEMAFADAALTGFGVEAVRRVPTQSRGLAMGAYTAFLDLAQGLRESCAWPHCGRAEPECRLYRQCRHGALRNTCGFVADGTPDGFRRNH